MGRNSFTDTDLEIKAIKLRKRLLQAIVGAGAGHTGGGLSCLDILNVLYNRVLRVSRSDSLATAKS
jgi:transketolase